MKESLGIVTIILSIMGHIPYILDTLSKKTKPHVFTWTIWSIVTILVFLGQWTKGGGTGSWGTGMTAILCVSIALMALRNGIKEITRSDVYLFCGAIVAIILWYFTKEPTLSVIIATIIDACAFIPTIRKTLRRPKSETFATYALNVLRHSLSIVALQQYNLATLLYPVYLVIMNGIMTSIMVQARATKHQK